MKSIYQKNREGVLHATWTSDSTDHGDEEDEEEEEELDLEPKQNNQHKYCGNKIQEHRYSQLLLLTEVDFPGGDLSSGLQEHQHLMNVVFNVQITTCVLVLLLSSLLVNVG